MTLNRLCIIISVLAVFSALFAWAVTGNPPGPLKIGALLLMFLLFAASELIPGSHPLKATFAKLNSPDAETRDAGMEEVDALLPKHWRSILDWSTRDFPDDDQSGVTIGVQLVNHFFDFHPPGLIPELEKSYDRLGDRYHERREAIFSCLMNMKNEAGAIAVARLVRRHASDLISLTPLFIALRGAPEYAACMLPGLMEAAPDLGTQNCSRVYQIVARYADADLCFLNNHPDFVKFCLDRIRTIVELEPPRTSRELFEADYLEDELEALQELARRFPSGDIEPLLELACVRRPKGSATHIQALCHRIERAHSVDPLLLESLAADPAVRWRLWLGLDNIDCIHAFPKRYNNRRDIAEAEMVGWLTYPTEMGHAPEEIELLTVVDYPSDDDEKLVAYFYRFRHPEFEDGKWIVGMAGPYPKDPPSTQGGYKTFSIFKEYNSKSLEEHIADYMPEE